VITLRKKWMQLIQHGQTMQLVAISYWWEQRGQMGALVQNGIWVGRLPQLQWISSRLKVEVKKIHISGK